MNIFLVENLQKPSLYVYNIREQLTKIKFEIKICLIFFFFFQKWATLYLICTREKYFFNKQAKKKYNFQVQPLKC